MASATSVASTPGIRSGPRLLVCGILAALVLLAYLPTLNRPLLEDDYPNLLQANKYGPVSGWAGMSQDPVFRVRATSWLLLSGLNQLFGTHAAGYYASLLLLHIVNTWLIYGIGVWRIVGFELSAWAAGFFAVYEGHQEAIMWLSASSELLTLCFGLLSFLLWIRFLQGSTTLVYACSLIAFCLALLSKESAVVIAGLLALPVALDKKVWRFAVHLAPFAALAFAAGLSIVHTRSYSFRFQDGSFSLQAPFWFIWPENIARLFWFWGLLSLVAILVWRPPGFRRILAIGFPWIGIGLIPYSFLTYSTRIPSRQLYLASGGLALIAGFALSNLSRRYWRARPALVFAVCALVAGENVTYIWTKKRAQFVERAAPTEQLIALARRTPGPIYVQCFPRPPIVAESAMEFAAGRPATDLIWNAEEAAARHATATFCYGRR